MTIQKKKLFRSLPFSNQYIEQFYKHVDDENAPWHHPLLWIVWHDPDKQTKKTQPLTNVFIFLIKNTAQHSILDNFQHSNTYILKWNVKMIDIPFF